ncbi:MAG: hypothetical protein IKB16_06470 [Lentisphaeria bacterium]|nr:hypothetical protein [Lentisphaeria bacterium]
MNECFKQPAVWKFIDDLRKPEVIHLHWDISGKPMEPEIFCEFNDPEGLLESAVDGLRNFMKSAIRFHCPIRIVQLKKNWKTESYQLETAPSSATISACDLEGLRRGIYHLIQLWKSLPRPALPKQKIKKTPWLKNRISRCFFSPINRPPANRDELLDDMDYYPDAYLDRLAAAGINGLWLSAEFEQLSGSSFTGEADETAKRRLEKLQQTVNKCRRYGIRIFLQMNGPKSRAYDDPLFQKCPSIRGYEVYGTWTFCPSTPEGQQYLEEVCRNIFTSVKHLGGILNITLGEAITTCASFDHTLCPRCRNVEWKEILHNTWRAMRKGMDAGNPDADLISWLYVAAPTFLDEKIYTLLDGAPDRVIVQLNCESGSVVRQNGKDYQIGDYWLATDTPSQNFINFAETAKKFNTPIGAKLQVGCSHEVATVPYVPVPGILYRKYKRLKELHVSTVMQCWYFGNYPGLMNMAAGQLAFEDFKDTEEDFLFRLAVPEWGKYAKTVMKVWKTFSQAYTNYPATNMFQYFGPVADGISWPLYMEDQNRGLTSTWLLDPEINGDNIVECLMEMDMEDVLVQMHKLSSQWHKGQLQYEKLRETFAANKERTLDINLGKALDIQFNSALNILRFYQLRSQMFTIRNKEITNTRQMLALTELDNRLGFHSEAEGYKYYPEKLQWRLQQLMKGNKAAECSYKIGSGWCEMENYRWKIERLENGYYALEAEMQGHLPGMDEISFAFDDGGTKFPLLLHGEQKGRIYWQTPGNVIKESKVIPGDDGWKLYVVINPAEYSARRPLRFNLLRLTDNYNTHYSWPAEREFHPPRLNLIFYQPVNMGILEE